MKTTRNLWPLGVIGAFAVFFCGMVTVVVIAETHRDSLVNGNYYEQELRFQDQIDSAARADKSGATLVYDATNRLLVITLPPTQRMQQLAGTIEFDRPSEPKLDRQFLLVPRGDGTQTVDVSNFASGPWLARAKWRSGGDAYFLEQKITIAGK